jgi:hypothetical protein
MKTTGWLNQNRYRAYPFVEDATPLIDGGPLPLDLCLDFSLIEYGHLLPPVPVYLVNVEFDGVDVIFMFEVGSNNYPIHVPYAAGIPYEAKVSVNAGGLHYDMLLVVGPALQTVVAWGRGIYTVTDAQIEPALVQFQTKHRVVSLLGDAPDSVQVAGDVYFKEGYGISVLVASEQDLIRLNGYPGAGAGYECAEITPSSLDIVLDAMDQPVGTLEIDGHVYQFGEAPDPGSGSGSGEEDLTIYVPYGVDALTTFENLYQALIANDQFKEHDYVISGSETGSDSSIATIRLRRDASLVRNAKDAATSIHLDTYTPDHVSCSEAVLAINDVTPDGYGNIELRGGKGVAITSDKANHLIRIKNTLDKDNAACGKCEDGAPNA